MIHLQNLSHKFPLGKTSFTALENINLEIKKGSFNAIIGPSGSGKSTLLNLIAGLTKAQKGKIKVNEKDLSKLNDDGLSTYRNQKIGFIFQEFHLQPYLNVKENILLPCYFSSYAKVKEKEADRLIKEVGLEKKAKWRVNDLSGGQRQRTAIARALINAPEIIIADEATGNLDHETGKEILNLLKRLQVEHKTTLIIATHDEKIAKAAKNIFKIKDGKLI